MSTQFKSALSVILMSLCAAGVQAGALLLDFENDSDLASIRWAAQGQSTLARSPQFATTGQSSLLFKTPMWKAGMPEWPAFEFKPSITDWTGYDRLVVDITNPTDARHFFSLYVSDSKVPFRKGLSYTFDLPSRGFGRFVIPLSAFPKEVNRGDIAILHFFTERPRTDLTLYLDNIALLKKGESPAEPGQKLAQQLGTLALDTITTVQRKIASAGDAATLARFNAGLKTMREELASANLTLARLNAINAELAGLPGRAEHAVSVLRLQKACGEMGLPAGNMLVAAATSMEKVLPRSESLDVKPAKEIQISLARNEKESLQVAVVAATSDLRKVSVKVSDLKSASGAVFKQEQVDCHVVGYVQTKKRPPYAVSSVGWWPDPILDFLGPVDVAAGDVQTFWIRVRAPKDQPAGEYRGSVTVSAEGQAEVTLALTVRVRTFALPDQSPLPLAVTFAPMDEPTTETRQEQAEWRKTADYPLNAWRKHKLRWADMLADYYLTYDSLYHRGMPDYEVLAHLHHQGRLGMFNLGYYDYPGTKPEDVESWKTKNLPRFREAYAKAKELGIQDHAYIYGADEAGADFFPRVQQAAAMLKAEFPDVPVMTTTYDQSYGMQSVIKSMDAFCPLTPVFDPAKAAAARAAGKQVWWYICCGPHHPHANMFIEYPAIEGRLLMGAMTAKQRPDGFLYYEISIWNSRKPITSGPFTDWDARSWTTYHGDGSWTCVGPDGKPLPTIRLENFRDGLEDYAYVKILEEIIRQREAKGDGRTTLQEKQWLAEAKAAVTVPQTLVKTMAEYSREPAKLYAWRNRIGDLIDSSGAGAVNPWGKR